MTNQEYNLTIMDIDWEDGQEYMIQIGRKDPFKVVVSEGDLSFEVNGISCSFIQDITTRYTLEEIALASVERYIDWSKVPVDTKVLVKANRCDSWKRAYFAEFEDGKYYCFVNGKTSWTAKDLTKTYGWPYAKLAEEE